MSQSAGYFIVEASAMPEIFRKVAEAKRLLETGEETTVNGAARAVGISRSAFYKYKDAVFPYDAERSGSILTLHLILRDRPGVLSSVLSSFAAAGVNILTVNQNIPAGGVASVSISARTDRLERPVKDFIQSVQELPGVERIARITGGGPDGAEGRGKK